MGKPSSKSDLTSKADRKFAKKLQFYTKVRDTIASLSAKSGIGKKKKLRSRQKKLKAYDLSALSDFLPDVRAPSQHNPAPEFKLNCKSRGKLILREGTQLNAVLGHPAFKADPIAAIQQHLERRQPAVDKKKELKKVKKGGKKKKSKNSNSSSANAMES